MTLMLILIIVLLLIKIYFKSGNSFKIHMYKSLSKKNNNGSDLLLLRHEFGETIFEFQSEINDLKNKIILLENQIEKLRRD